MTLSLVMALSALLVSGTGTVTAREVDTPHVTPDEARFSTQSYTEGVPRNQPERGLIYDGLKPATSGPCAGLFQVGSTGACTHGPDPAPPGKDVKRPVPPLKSVAGRSTTPGTNPAWCEGDGRSGRRTHVIYARASDKADRYSQYLASFRQWAIDADTIYNASAAETGGSRHIRYVHDTSCALTVANVVLSATADDNFGNTISELRAKGYTGPDRKYMVFMDATVLCGIGEMYPDDSPGPGNLNNTQTVFARTDSGCSGGHTAAHEHNHNLGSVQDSAPNYSGNGHCTDEYDVMCYVDGPGVTMRIVCSDTGHENRLDCGHNDYYHTNPPAGSYLATHWNTASSGFLIGAPAPTCPDAGREPDNTRGTAKAFAIGSTQARAFCEAGDEDWVSFTALADASYKMETLNLSSGGDTILQLYSSSGALLAENDDAGVETRASMITYTTAAAGTYYLRALQYANPMETPPSGLDRTYDLRITGPADTTAPVAGAPVTGLLAGSYSASTTTMPVRVSWPAATDASPSSGILRYELRQKTGTGAYGAATYINVPTGSAIRSLAPGTYGFQLRAQDKAGNWSLPKATSVVVVAYDEQTAGVTYPAGTWTRRASSSSYGGYVVNTPAAGARTRISFTGRSIGWVSTKYGNRGKADVYEVNPSTGALTKVGTVDLYSPSLQTRRVVFSWAWSTSAARILEIRVLGTQNASATGMYVDVDGFVALK